MPRDSRSGSFSVFSSGSAAPVNLSLSLSLFPWCALIFFFRFCTWRLPFSRLLYHQSRVSASSQPPPPTLNKNLVKRRKENAEPNAEEKAQRRRWCHYTATNPYNNHRIIKLIFKKRNIYIFLAELHTFIDRWFPFKPLLCSGDCP